ncbi:MerR family transcriptional regulator [Kibdelosporangium phytohabitans]|uniref:HTH merR-type domain-containing protein n=1 Tax=Kibdelosporangium phytohabitans TaxID=860235 RepID=A0A0N9I2M2_9PSEU|nr:MerR family transcriptional regulator [Kibdelosporangium phytohabitans]ALG09931.1 hypothetical protein AOZ06_26230 [Kibdelosporangium phytohabitans]MBE1468662.1 DNA-binding transcriptional MerR regulator [Kibdelosporangium phytohabitans]
MDGPSTPLPAGTSDAEWTPGAAARLLGIAPSTLRGWHRRYHLPIIGHGDGRHRRYTRVDLIALTHMRDLIAQGMSAPSAARLAFHRDEPTPRASIAAGPAILHGHALRLDADTLTSTLDAHIARDGVATTWDQICRPVLAVFGGTTTGPATTGADECVDIVHLLSWTITAALHRVRPPTMALPATAPVLLACVTGERHTLALEVLRAALAETGTPVRFLGADLPDTALAQALRRTAPTPRALVLWAHTTGPVPTTTHHTCVTRGVRLLLAGPGWNIHAPPTLTHLTSLQHALTTLTTP